MVLRFILETVIALCCCVVIQCVIYPTVQWSPNNPKFATNYTLFVKAYSKITLVCPNPTTVLTEQERSQSKENMYENIWLVDKQGYETCKVDTNNTSHRLLKDCNNPLTLDYYDIVFQIYSPDDNGLTFSTGKEYYLISTSSGTEPSLTKKSGGHCMDDNMRLKIYLCTGKYDQKCKGSSFTQNAQKVSVSTVTQTVTYCPTPTSSLIKPTKVINVMPSRSASFSNNGKTPSFNLHGAQGPGPTNIVRSKYSRLLSSSNLKPTKASQSQTSTTHSGFNSFQLVPT